MDDQNTTPQGGPGQPGSQTGAAPSSTGSGWQPNSSASTTNSYDAAYGAQASSTPASTEPYAAPYQTQQQATQQQATQQVPQASAQHAPQPATAPAHAQHSAGAYSAPQGGQVYVAPQAKSSSGGKTFLIAFAGALLACVLALGVSSAFGLLQGQQASVNLGATNAKAIEAVEDASTLAEAVADKCLPSVASITVYGQSTSTGAGSIYDYFYGYGGDAYGGGADNGDTQLGMGSGVVLSEDGYVITNYHVVAGGSRFEVTIEGEVYEATLVGTDASSDVAVIKVQDASGFTPIEIGDSDDLTIGEWVMSIGSPFGLEQSVATGIVSATSRSQIMDAESSMLSGGSGEVTIYPNMIQTDAAINPGNSGGALVDAQGRLIGINTLITSYSGNYSGVGFAIPSNYAISLAKDIIEGKTPTHAQLGVNLTTVNESTAERYGFTVDEGAYVSNVIAGSAADKAGIKTGDIIISFDGNSVESASDLMLDVREKAPGDTVNISLDRDGQIMDFDVTLGSDQ